MNKIGLAILLLLSAVLVLYPSITALIDAQNVLSEYSSYIPEQYLAVRDKAVMQVLGFVFLFVFLGLFLNHYFGKQQSPSPQINPIIPVETVNQPTQPQVKQLTSNRINSQWSIVIGMLAGIGISAWKLISDIPYSGSPDFGSVITYGAIASFAVGIGSYFLFKHVIEVER